MNWYKLCKYTDKLKGGKADDKVPSDFPKKEVERGHRVEFEHTDNPDTAREITMDHLQEHGDYYTGLKHMENMLSEIENKKEDTKDARGLYGKPQGDESRRTQQTLNERYQENEIIEGEHVKALKRMMKNRDWDAYKAYIRKLKEQGHSEDRINSMVSRAGVGVRL